MKQKKPKMPTRRVVFVTTKWLLLNHSNSERTSRTGPDGTATRKKTEMTVEPARISI